MQVLEAPNTTTIVYPIKWKGTKINLRLQVPANPTRDDILTAFDDRYNEIVRRVALVQTQRKLTEHEELVMEALSIEDDRLAEELNPADYA